ncbi:MAG: hypothetical protein ABI194_06690 [Gemmatimonadaceae bacterium]
MKHALEVLLAGTVDYAGLFPPAALPMAEATEQYADYLHDPARAMLGRFVVPVLRLREFDAATAVLLPRGEDATPWRLSALPGPDLAADFALALAFNDRHNTESGAGHAIIDAFEIRAPTSAEIDAASSIMPEGFAPFFEVPIATDPAPLLDAVRRAGAFAKARTGGVTAAAFPSAAEVARFMSRCREAGVGFKLTAGLHHPVRAEYRLSYEADAQRGLMFGYLNAFVAAVLVWDGAPESEVMAALVSVSPRDFSFSDDNLTFRDRSVSVARVRDARENFIISFGSCSFREPVDELASLSIF